MMSRQPTRQLSLQQPPKRSQIRRQRSADDNRSNESSPLLYHNIPDQQIKSRREKSNRGSSDRPKVRIAWSSNMEETSKVEVIASRIGTASNKTLRSNMSSGTSSVITSDKATILYSRQELAERLRLAWKQREANKSNIDIFLAHDTTTEERCDSRMSSSSATDQKTQEDEKPRKSEDEFQSQASPSSSSPSRMSSTEENDNLQKSKQRSGIIEKEVRVTLIQDARAKRTSFQSGTNLAFNGTVQKTTFMPPVIKDTTNEKLERPKERSSSILIDPKAKRTNSAPPLQRRVGLSSPGGTSGPSRSRVNIIIDTPKMTKPIKIEQRDSVKSSPRSEDVLGENNSIPTIQVAPQERTKSSSTKKRTRNGKRRVDDSGRKSELTKSNPDVVTMVSLVSDADSDSEVEKNSPRDDKLVRQLRSNLPTTPIIKSCPLIMSTGNLSTSGTVENSLIPRRVLKSVSFQQDSIDGEIQLGPQSAEKKLSDSLPKIILLQEEIRTTWQAEICNNLETSVPSLPSTYWEDSVEVSQTLTDREKRCLVVPIGDPRDKKRKLLLQRTKSVPSRICNEDRQATTIQMETKEFGTGRSGVPERQSEESIGPAVALTTPISKLIHGNPFGLGSVDVETVEPDVQSVEPHLKTTKEKECWHLYRRMCDKGVCVSFDTVLRGMLTPTEYRLRRREIT